MCTVKGAESVSPFRRDGRLEISLAGYIISTRDKSIELEDFIYRLLLCGR